MTPSKTFRRLSIALGLRKNPQASPAGSTGTLADFLSTTKQEYLEAVNGTASKGTDWTDVMGNEAGDLDTVASSIAYAWIESVVYGRPTVPLIPIEPDDLNLRPENLYAFQRAGIHKPREQLLFLTDIPQLQNSTTPFPSQRFALVDHNKIKDRYLLNNAEARVVAVIDHHEDEGFYKETADPRIILPCGSCCSHVTSSVLPSPDKLPSGVEIPRELATLLLCGITIDTNGLRPGGKATQTDQDAASTLFPLSTLAQNVPLRFISPPTTGTKPNKGAIHDEKSMKELATILSTKKKGLSHLKTRDLLRRDYKENEYKIDWLPGTPTIRVGLSTIPVALKDWAKEGEVEKDILLWMKTRGLHIYGAIIPSKGKPGKKDKKSSGKGKDKKKGKDKEEGKDKEKEKTQKEQLWMVVDPAVLDGDAEAYSADGKKIDVEKLVERLWSELEADKGLNLQPHTKLKLNKNDVLPNGIKVKVYHQTNTEPTRKYIAPLLKKILLEGEEASPGKAIPNGEISEGNGANVNL